VIFRRIFAKKMSKTHHFPEKIAFRGGDDTSTTRWTNLVRDRVNRGGECSSFGSLTCLSLLKCRSKFWSLEILWLKTEGWFTRNAR